MKGTERTEPRLIKLVFREQHGEFLVVAFLSRYGGLAVFVEKESVFVWQGANIIEALEWVEEKEMEAA